MKLIYSGQFHSRVCSMMFLNANIWSVHPLLFRNPSCSCLSFLLIAVSILPRRILQKTLLGMDKSVIPRQLSQTWRLPFLRIFIMSPLSQSLGIVSLSQMVSNKLLRTLVAVLRSAFNMNGVYAWGFSTLHSFDGISNFRFCWGSGVDVEVIWHWWGVGGFIWLRVVQDFTELFNPSISLFTFSCNSAAIFPFHRGRVSSVITTETFGDLVDSAHFTSCCRTLSFCC